MAQMFQMMNLARMETGHMPTAVLPMPFIMSVIMHGKNSGQAFTNPRGERTAIINHEDIRRTLIMGKAHTEAFGL